MAKVTGPLFSFDASGTVGNAVTFSKWKGRSIVKRKATPSNPKTSPQVGIRASFAGCIAAYKALTTGNQSLWKLVGQAAQTTGLNAMVKRGQRNLKALMGIQQLPTQAASVAPYHPTGLAAVVNGDQVTLTWTDDVTANAYLVYLYQALTTGFSPGPANLIAVIALGVETYVYRPGVGIKFVNVKSVAEDGTLTIDGMQATFEVEEAT